MRSNGTDPGWPRWNARSRWRQWAGRNRWKAAGLETILAVVPTCVLTLIFTLGTNLVALALTVGVGAATLSLAQGRFQRLCLAHPGWAVGAGTATLSVFATIMSVMTFGTRYLASWVLIVMLASFAGSFLGVGVRRRYPERYQASYPE